jgi:hypothetical protein
MAGQDQSANLGGMLSQIGQTLGTPVDTTAFTNNITNTFRPEVDPNDPTSLQNYARWAGRVGKTEESMLYNKQAATLREEQKVANIQKATAAATNRYRAAVLSGDKTAVDRENLVLDKMGEQLGVDTARIRSGIDQEKRTTDIANLQLSAAQTREKEVKAAEQVSQVASSVISKFGVDSPQFEKLKEAPLLQENRELVQNLEARELRLVNERAQRAEFLAEQNTAPDISYLGELVASKKLPEEQGRILKKQYDTLKASIEGKEAGQWMPGEKRKLEKDISDLERQASSALTTVEALQNAERKAAQSSLRTVRGRQTNQSADKWEVEQETDSLLAQLSPAATFDFGMKEVDEAITQADVDKNSDVLTQEDKGLTVAQAAARRVLEKKRAAFDPLISEYEAQLRSGNSTTNLTADDYL